MRSVVERGGWRGRLTRSLVPALFGVAATTTAASAVRGVAHALGQPTTHAWLLAGYDVLRAGVAVAFVLFTIGRAEPRRRARNPLAYAACAAAIASVILFAQPPRSTPQGLILTGEAVAVGAYLWLLASVIALGRCFGVLPEARGLVTRGPYRIVRHPVYLGEIGACIGLAAASPSPRNAAALAALIAAQSLRLRLEERALTDSFPDYAAYAAETPRLLPRLVSSRSTSAAASSRLNTSPARIAAGDSYGLARSSGLVAAAGATRMLHLRLARPGRSSVANPPPRR
jgi:protein-S-isoprenylcysteine O-methyltransferase Ste14